MVCIFKVTNLSSLHVLLSFCKLHWVLKESKKVLFVVQICLEKGHSKSAPDGLKQNNTSMLAAMEAVRQATVSTNTAAILHGEPN